MFDEDYGVQSYFGESGDCDFFGDTSMSGGFASGMGEAGFVSEAFAQDSMGGSFFTEASEFDTMGGEFFTEANNSTRKRFGDMTEASSKATIDSEDKRYDDFIRKNGQTPGASTSAKNNSTHVTPENIADRRRARSVRDTGIQTINRRIMSPDTRKMMIQDLNDQVDTADKHYEASKRHGREIGKHMGNK